MALYFVKFTGMFKEEDDSEGMTELLDEISEHAEKRNAQKKIAPKSMSTKNFFEAFKVLMPSPNQFLWFETTPWQKYRKIIILSFLLRCV